MKYTDRKRTAYEITITDAQFWALERVYHSTAIEPRLRTYLFGERTGTRQPTVRRLVDLGLAEYGHNYSGRWGYRITDHGRRWLRASKRRDTVSFEVLMGRLPGSAATATDAEIHQAWALVVGIGALVHLARAGARLGPYAAQGEQNR